MAQQILLEYAMPKHPSLERLLGVRLEREEWKRAHAERLGLESLTSGTVSGLFTKLCKLANGMWCHSWRVGVPAKALDVATKKRKHVQLDPSYRAWFLRFAQHMTETQKWYRRRSWLQVRSWLLEIYGEVHEDVHKKWEPLADRPKGTPAHKRKLTQIQWLRSRSCACGSKCMGLCRRSTSA